MCKGRWRFFKPLPILVIVIVMYSYYAYVYEMCIVKITSIIKKLIYLILYHWLLLIMLIHYFMAMCIWPAEIPDKYRFSKSYYYAIKDLEQGDPKVNRMLQSFCASRGIRTYLRKHNCIRYCLKCKLVKPDRTHHCSTCKACVVKMDHHCPWLDNCIGYTNYKIYLLLLVHSVIYCTFYTVTSLEYVYFFFERESERKWLQVNYVIGCIASLTFGILLAILLVCHCSAVLNNETTIETLSDYEMIDNCSFNLGKLDNVLEVCGYNWCLWCLPLQTSLGDGVEFPVICP